MKKSYLISIIVINFCLPIFAVEQELTLEQAMDKAEKYSATSRSIAIASRMVDINRSNKNATILGMFPNLSLQGQYLKPVNGVNALTSASISPDLALTTIGTSFTAGLTLNQPVIGLYNQIMQLGQTSALLRASIHNKNQTVQDIRYLAAASFINCTKSFQLIKVANAAIEAAQKQMDDAQARFNEGLLTNADVLKFKLERDNARTARVHAETSYQISLATLAEVIGESNLEAIVLPSDYKSVMEDKKTTLLDINTIVSNRLPLRYDVLSAQEMIKAQGYARLNTIGSYFPTLNFLITYAHDFNKAPVLDRSGNVVFPKEDVEDTMFYGASLTWNILDWGIRQTQINAAGAQEQIARLQLIETKDKAKVEITSYYAKLLAAYESLNLTKLSVEYSENVYQQRVEQFQNGFISSTDLVIATNDQTTARANYVNAIGDLDLAWMGYFLATRQRITTLDSK